MTSNNSAQYNELHATPDLKKINFDFERNQKTEGKSQKSEKNQF